MNPAQQEAQAPQEVPQGRVDLKSFYNKEVEKVNEENAIPGSKAWKTLEKASEKKRAKEERSWKSRETTVSDKIRRKGLMARATVEGIRDLKTFERIVDFIESTSTDTVHKYVKVSKNLSPEQKEAILEKWKSKGWHGSIHDFRDDEKELTLRREFPVRLGPEYVRSIKRLVSKDNNAMELVEGLAKLGLNLDTYYLGSAGKIDKLSIFFNAPHAKEALEIASKISNWDYRSWFPTKENYWGEGPVEVGNIDLLIRIAQSDNPSEIFPQDLIKKVETLSKALDIRISPKRIEEFQEIMANPTYLDFVAMLAGGEKTGYDTNKISILEQMTILEEAGVLDPIVKLFHSGVFLERRGSGSDSSLERLFDSYKATSEEVRKEVIQGIKGLLALPEVGSLLSDPKKQEFMVLFTNKAGSVFVSELPEFEFFLSPAMAQSGRILEGDPVKMERAIYILSLVKPPLHHMAGEDVKRLQNLITNAEVIGTVLHKDFPEFLRVLNEKTGYVPSISGLSQSVTVYNDAHLRSGLLGDETVGVIKAFHPDGQFSLHNAEYFVELSKNPDALSVINALKDLGLKSSQDLDKIPVDSSFSSLCTPEAISKLTSKGVKDLAQRLWDEFKWKIEYAEIFKLIELSDNKDLQEKLFLQENVEFIRKIKPTGLHLLEVDPILSLDLKYRPLFIKLADSFDYHPNFLLGDLDLESFDKLLASPEITKKLFSPQTIELFRRLKDQGYYYFDLKDIDNLVNAPPDFSEFIEELATKYKYKFNRWEFEALVTLSKDRSFYKVLDNLVKYGYEFNPRDIKRIAALTPYAEKIDPLISTLLQVSDYKFNIEDAVKLGSLVELGIDERKLVQIKSWFDKYSPSPGGFDLNLISDLAPLAENEDFILRLEQYGYKFTVYDAQILVRMLNSPNKESVFGLLDTFKTNYSSFIFDLHSIRYYEILAQIPGIENKIREASVSVSPQDLLQNLALFTALDANPSLFNHAMELLLDSYFKNTRDAQNRTYEFMRGVKDLQFPDSVVARIFALSQKPTELDHLSYKLQIVSEIAKITNTKGWEEKILQAGNFAEANEILNKLIIELPVGTIYSDLKGEELQGKLDQLIEFANKDKVFEETLEICCRSVGIYAKKYSGYGPRQTMQGSLGILIKAIRDSLELNLTRDPKLYLQKRALVSEHQFDRIFDGFPQDVKDKVMAGWLDLSSKRRLRVSGDIVTREEATLSRLNRIKDIVQTDLSVHLETLFLAKIKELEGLTNGQADQLLIFKEYLLAPEGQVRKDVPDIFRSVEKFILTAQRKLKSAETPKDEKAKLGRNLGTYQAISDSLKALYRLGTISEQRYKTKRDYVGEIDKHIGVFSSSLKKLRIVDPERRSQSPSVRALEEEVLLDLSKLKETMAEENVAGQAIFDTESTVAFNDLARAPEMTQSCQRLTEETGYNQAAYSRLLDGNNEMIDMYEVRDGQKVRLARSFIELSRISVEGKAQPKVTILLDRQYVNPQYHKFTYQFWAEMISHMLDRMDKMPQVSLLFDHRIGSSEQIEEMLRARGYKITQISGQYLINRSNVELEKYYDSLGGLNSVAEPHFNNFSQFYMIEKA